MPMPGAVETSFFSNTAGQITLVSPLPHLANNINILGPGTNVLVVSGGGSTSIFSMNAGTTNTLSNLTIADGFAVGQTYSLGMGVGVHEFPGCGISNSGCLTLIGCQIRNCKNNGNIGSVSGGAVCNSGILDLQNCGFTSCGCRLLWWLSRVRGVYL